MTRYLTFKNKSVFLSISIIFFLSFFTTFFIPDVAAKGDLTIPSTGSITQSFLSQILPDTHGSYYDQNDQFQKSNLKFHLGVDISNGNTDCSQNLSPIYASGPGKVIYADYDTSGFGWSVRIDHGLSVSNNNKYAFTIYAHMGTPDVKRKRGQSCLMVKQGDNVSEGDLIGYQGSSGRSTGTHLHWGIKVNPTSDDWRNKDSKWASPDFYTCLALTEGSLPLNFVSSGQNQCNPPKPSIITTIPIENGFRNLGVNPYTNRIYITNNFYTYTSIIDGSKNNIVSSIPAGNSGVGVNPNTNLIYVANYGSNNLSVIDGSTNNIITTIPVGNRPNAVGINPTTNRIYVINIGNRPYVSVSVIDGSTNTVINSISIGTIYPSPLHSYISINPITNRIYATYNGNGYSNFSVIDGNTNAVISTIPAGGSGVGVNPNTNRIYVANNVQPGSVSVIDGSTNTVITNILVGDSPFGIVANPNTNHIFVANINSNNISVIDGFTNSIITTIPGLAPTEMSINIVTNNIYVLNIGNNTISVIHDM